MCRDGTMNCQIEYVSSDSDIGMPCGKLAVAKCPDCGTAICSDCYTDCCGDVRFPILAGGVFRGQVKGPRFSISPCAQISHQPNEYEQRPPDDENNRNFYSLRQDDREATH